MLIYGFFTNILDFVAPPTKNPEPFMYGPGHIKDLVDLINNLDFVPV